MVRGEGSPYRDEGGRMSRDLPEWIGRADDAKIPPRVIERVARKADGRCVHVHSNEDVRPLAPVNLGATLSPRARRLVSPICHTLS